MTEVSSSSATKLVVALVLVVVEGASESCGVAMIDGDAQRKTGQGCLSQACSSPDHEPVLRHIHKSTLRQKKHPWRPRQEPAAERQGGVT